MTDDQIKNYWEKRSKMKLVVKVVRGEEDIIVKSQKLGMQVWLKFTD